MFNPNDSKIEARVQQFVQEITTLVRQSALETLQGVLGNGVGTQRRRGRPARAAGGRRGRRPSANVEQAVSKILSYVRSHDGQGVIEIAKGTGISLKDAKKAVLRLLASGQLKKSGVRRGTKYHVGSGRAPAAKAKRGKRKARKARKVRARKPGAATEAAAA